MNLTALAIALVGGTIAQVAMVVAGHRRPALKRYYAVGGMGFSLLAGVAYGVLDGTGPMQTALTGGALSGGLCGLLGIAVSFALRDVPWTLLIAGTLSSSVTGLLGAAITRWIGMR